MSQAVTTFKMGQAVPDWLLALEPIDATSRRGEGLRFGTDVHVVEAEDYYLILPLRFEPVAGLLDAAGSHHCAIWAASKPVRLMNVETQALPRERRPTEGVGPYVLVVQPHAMVLREQVVRRDHWLRRLFGFAQRRQ